MLKLFSKGTAYAGLLAIPICLGAFTFIQTDATPDPKVET